MIRHWLRDPLVHFLIAGAVIWAGLALVGEPVDLMIVDPNFDNSSIAARGEIVVVNERYGIRITALARPEDKADLD